MLTTLTNCHTCMCVYMIMYRYGLRYIGSARCKIKVRIQEHQSKIQHAITEAPLVQHFQEHNHSPEDFTFVILELLSLRMCEHKDLYRELLQHATYWIFKVDTVAPKGLNPDIDYSVYL